MSRKEVDQITLFESIKKAEITQKKAAEFLGLTREQVCRKFKKYKQGGPETLAHRGRGRQSNRKISDLTLKKIKNLLMTTYKGFGPTFAAEKLLEYHSIKIDHETLRRLMIKWDIWYVRRKKKERHVWRERKHCFGEMLQVDGSYHKWFNDSYSTLLALIDDATGKVELMFADQETIQSLSEITKTYIKKHGIPRKLYTDRGKVFKVNIHNAKGKKKTQYERMCDELGIEFSHAYSPQAKGRVERLFGTLQDRLCKELSLQGIKTIEQANKFLKERYMSLHNERFGKKPYNNLDLHRPFSDYDLDSIFCIKEKRILNNDYTIRYNNRWFQLEKKQSVTLQSRATITVLRAFDGTIRLKFKDNKLLFKEIFKEKELPRQEKLIENTSDKRVYGHPPKKNHPWRSLGSLTKRIKKCDISIELKK
ncbi:MAG: ISNCY family transposase [Candidatus Dependentiae bacterium]